MEPLENATKMQQVVDQAVSTINQELKKLKEDERKCFESIIKLVSKNELSDAKMACKHLVRTRHEVDVLPKVRDQLMTLK